MKSIILIAPPAAGKGTQSKFIESEYNIPHISIGDLLRNIIASGSELGKSLENIINEGKLINDEIIINLLKQRLINNDCSNGYILDGFPRNLNQAKAYEKILDELNLSNSMVIYLDLDKDIALKRILGRTMCPNCGLIYNEFFRETSPINTGLCDKCHKKLVKRSDDNLETFNKRYDTYYIETKPLIDYYQKKGILFIIDSNMNKEKVFNQIKKVVEENNDKY